MSTTPMLKQSRVVAPAEWLAARKELLKKEKEFSRLRDELTRQRRELPWEKVAKKYEFDGAQGKETLADLFGSKSQLLVYHFMLGPGWVEGCPSCSFLADHFDGSIPHLGARDVSFRVRRSGRSRSSRSAWAGNSSGCPRTERISTMTSRCP